MSAYPLAVPAGYPVASSTGAHSPGLMRLCGFRTPTTHSPSPGGLS